VVHERALRDSGPLGDASRRERAVSVLDQATDGLVEDRLPRALALAGAVPADAGAPGSGVCAD